MILGILLFLAALAVLASVFGDTGSEITGPVTDRGVPEHDGQRSA